MRGPAHAAAPAGTGPLTARLVIGHAWAMTRARRGRVAGAAAVFFVPAAAVWFAAQALRPDPADPVALRIVLAALVVLGANLVWTLGVVAFAGFLDLAVGDDYFRRRPHDLATVVRTLPWGALVAVDLFLVAGLMVGLAAFVVPGIVVGVWFGLVGPVVVHERRRPLDALRRTARISRPHWPLVLGLVVVPWWVEAFVSEPVREAVHGGGLLLHAAVEWLLAVTILAAVGALEVALAAELMARNPDGGRPGAGEGYRSDVPGDAPDPTEMARPQVSTRDHAELGARLEEWFAHRGRGAVTVTDLATPEGTGMSSDTVLFRVVPAGADGGGAAYVARLAPDPDAHPLFPDYALDRQYRTMAEVAARSAVPVPPLVAHEADPGFLGTEFLVMGRVEGVVPADIPPYAFGVGWLAEATAADRARLQGNVVDVLADLHAIPDAPGAFPWLDPGGDALRAHVDGQRAFADWVLDGRTGALIDAGFAWLEAHWPAGPFETVLSWGDARIGNILFADFTPVAVLDWEMAALGPPELDVSWTIFLHRFFDDLAVQFGLPGLPDFLRRGDVVAAYEARAGRRLRDLDWFTTYAAVRHAVIMTRVGLRSVHFGEAEMPASLDDLVTHRPALEAMLAGTYWDGVPA